MLLKTIPMLYSIPIAIVFKSMNVLKKISMHNHLTCTKLKPKCTLDQETDVVQEVKRGYRHGADEEGTLV